MDDRLARKIASMLLGVPSPESCGKYFVKPARKVTQRVSCTEQIHAIPASFRVAEKQGGFGGGN